MTRARALKQTIRARAAKTGERYTAARRHVLNDMATGARSSTPAARPVAAPNTTKGAVSDARVREKTGHALDHWFAVLDRFGAVQTGHSAAARHLHADHGVDGWYSQGITVAYERARGVRAINQRVGGAFEVSVTKTVNGDTRTVARAFTQKARRARWLAGVDPELAGALSDAVSAKAFTGVVIRDDGLGRFRYKWGATTVQFYLIPKGTDRTSVVATHMRLASAAVLERRRAEWRAALAALARLLGN